MPIISPWTFYLINLVDGALIIFVIIFVFCAVAAGVTGLAYFDAPDDELGEGAKKWFKRFITKSNDSSDNRKIKYRRKQKNK